MGIHDTGRQLNKLAKITYKEHFLKSERRTPELLEYLHHLEAKAQASNRSIAQEALKWVLDQKGVTSVLVGASSVEQLKNNLQTIF